MVDALFYLLSLGLIVASLSVALSPYPVRSILSLIGAFVLTSVLWLSIGAEFLALALIFVYVGAVMALFLFIVFMINIDHLKSHISRYMMMGMISLLLVSFLMIIWRAYGVLPNNMLAPITDSSNTRTIGVRLFQEYGLEFEYIAMILLSAMVAAIALVGKRDSQAKYQNIRQQMDRREEDCITWMKP